MKEITQKLLQLGIRPNHAGFKYLEIAIKYYLDHKSEIVKTMQAYEYTANYFKTTVSKVERAIRHAKDNSHTKKYKFSTAGELMATIALELSNEEI